MAPLKRTTIDSGQDGGVGMVVVNKDLLFEKEQNHAQPEDCGFQQQYERAVATTPKRNVTVAVNYEVSMVDQFHVENVPDPTESYSSATVDKQTTSNSQQRPCSVNQLQETHLKSVNNECSQQQQKEGDGDVVNTSNAAAAIIIEEETDRDRGNSSLQHRRRSVREKKKERILSRTRVRYDMQLVPTVQRNQVFLDSFSRWWMENSTINNSIIDNKSFNMNNSNNDETVSTSSSTTVAPENFITASTTVAPDNFITTSTPRRSLRLTTTKSAVGASTAVIGDSANPPALCDECSLCGVKVESESFPFLSNETVLWIPRNRQEWEDSVSEMTAVCTTAAIRRFLHVLPQTIVATASTSSELALVGAIASPLKMPSSFITTPSAMVNTDSSKLSATAFHPPLSRDYIRDRVDIDDPLHGFQLRHARGGWLQGFCIWTTFTTWSQDFEWNSLHPKSGIAANAIADSTTTTTTDTAPSRNIDTEGRLAQELQALERNGNAQENGIVFNSIAEIGLVGGLGCGEYLLRIALDSIRSSPQQSYKYVVLQATEQSKAFYERFGFVRVGAVCRYGRGVASSGEDTVDAIDPLEGYCHWTHANESKKSVQKHGGPSYMMCLKLPTIIEECDKEEIDSRQQAPSFFQRMMSLVAVEKKPIIVQLGNASTPGSKSFLSGRVVSNGFTIGSPLGRRGTTEAFMNYDMEKHSGKKRKRLLMASYTQLTRNSDHDPLYPSNTRRRTLKVDSLPKQAWSEFPSQLLIQPPLVSNCSQQHLKNIWVETQHAHAPDTTKKKNQRFMELNDPPSMKRCFSTPIKNKTKKIPIKSKSTYVKSSVIKTHARPRLISKTKKSQAMSSNIIRKQETRNKPASSRSAASLTSQPPRSPSSPRLSRSSAVDLCAPSSTRVQPRELHASRSPPTNSFVYTDKICRINTATLMKQKVKSYPRSRVHFYNRVVKLKNSSNNNNNFSRMPTYYFVLHYKEAEDTLILAPLASKGTLLGKREGRPRFQVVFEETSANLLVQVPSQHYQIVPATMIMKTPIVAQEAWDVEDNVTMMNEDRN